MKTYLALFLLIVISISIGYNYMEGFGSPGCDIATNRNDCLDLNIRRAPNAQCQWKRTGHLTDGHKPLYVCQTKY